MERVAEPTEEIRVVVDHEKQEGLQELYGPQLWTNWFLRQSSMNLYTHYSTIWFVIGFLILALYLVKFFFFF